MRFISQLIKGISRVLQKLLKYFSDNAISTFFLLPAAGILPVVLALNLNDSESVVLLCYHLNHLYSTTINLLMLLHNHRRTLVDYIFALQHAGFFHNLFGDYLFCWCSEEMVNNFWMLLPCFFFFFFFSTCLAAASASAPVNIIVHFTSMYTWLYTLLHHRSLELDLTICIAYSFPA